MSVYTVEITGAARRQLKKINRADKRKILDKIETLGKNPRPHGYKPLTDTDNMFRVRVGDYRIIYEIRNKILLVIVLRVANRRESYR
ncbi:MAG TPA: type II toxin-antitoxin system RelE/ParE family toxin [Pyrinomonadaceae bacterium]|nr:type II toxin-antitoxin system RelE/ParE family toxin [Pyrinomonadaceae bacterium]